MTFTELTKKRHSVRRFSARSVSDEFVQNILDAVRTAPSAGNLKAYEVTTVRDEELRMHLGSKASRHDFLGTAPVVFVFCARPDVSAEQYSKRGEQLYAIQDATIACSYAQLAAADLGLGSCWIGAFDEDEVKSILRLDQTCKPIALLPIGYEV